MIIFTHESSYYTVYNVADESARGRVSNLAQRHSEIISRSIGISH